MPVIFKATMMNAVYLVIQWGGFIFIKNDCVRNHYGQNVNREKKYVYSIKSDLFMSAGIVYNYIIIFKAVVKYIYIYVYYILEFHMEEQQKR